MILEKTFLSKVHRPIQCLTNTTLHYASISLTTSSLIVIDHVIIRWNLTYGRFKYINFQYHKGTLKIQDLIFNPRPDPRLAKIQDPTQDLIRKKYFLVLGQVLDKNPRPNSRPDSRPKTWYLQVWFSAFHNIWNSKILEKFQSILKWRRK